MEFFVHKDALSLPELLKNLSQQKHMILAIDDTSIEIGIPFSVGEYRFMPIRKASYSEWLMSHPSNRKHGGDPDWNFYEVSTD